ncbi:hypothetical protein [Longimicrobium sp.]|uniref:hypothetical protein n=1 Tax=Longimicrobium sp. TaxID=2029185 RepID=UPI003B3A3848
MKTRHWTLVAVLPAMLLGACSGPGKPSLGKPVQPAVVNVANNGFADVTVYVLQSGMRWRLGTVTGLSRGRFPLRFSHDVGDVYLLADPVGGARGYLSPAVRVQPGTAVDLRLHTTLSMSSVSVWGH